MATVNRGKTQHRKETLIMATRKGCASSKQSVEFLPEILRKSLEIMGDLALATGAASVDASVSSARHLIKFQRGSVKAGLGLISKVRDYTEKSLHEAVREGKWLPTEGREVIDEWSAMMKSGVDEFSRVTDKSFELLLNYLDRLEKGKPVKVTPKTKPTSATSKKRGSADSPARKAPARRKATPAKKKNQATK